MNDETLSPVYGFLRRPSMIDFPGRMAAVLFVSGCNFRCGFCHNAGLMAERKEGISWDRLADQCRRWRAQWVDAAVVTGGEPTLHPELARLLAFLKSLGWRIKLDTNGSRPDVLSACLDSVDYVAMDIKCGMAGYPELTGFADTERIRESIDLILSRARSHEFRTTVIDTVHTEEDMREIAGMVAGAQRYVLQPFLPRDDVPRPDLRSRPRTHPEVLQRLAAPLRGVARSVVVQGG